MGKKKLTVLLSSAGRRVELIQCFRTEAQALGFDLRVLAADLAPALSAACLAADLAVQVPRCTTPAFISELAALCDGEGVDLIVPTIDTELLNLAENRAALEAKGGRVLVSSPALVRMARDKAETMRFLGNHGIPVPRTALLKEVLSCPDGWEWPLMLKPVGGSSSVGIRQVRDLAEVELAAEARSDFLAQELLHGREYTVNLFFDQEGTLRAAVPHLRIETRGGEVSKGVTERHSGLMAVAEHVGKVLKGAQGPLCFQAIVTPEGRIGVFEINARFGGGYPLAHRAGARFTRWLLEEAAGVPCTASNMWEAGWTMLRHDASFFSKAADETRTRI